MSRQMATGELDGDIPMGEDIGGVVRGGKRVWGGERWGRETLGREDQHRLVN